MIGRTGVCSWSLQPDSPASLAAALTQTGATGVQLALDPIAAGDWTVQDTWRALDNASVSLLSGMWAPFAEDYTTLESIRITGGVRPDQHWSANLERARAIAAVAQDLGLSLITFHAGHVPADPHDPARRIMIDRLSTVIDLFTQHDLAVAFETGQETPENQLSIIAELRASVGINFDPANMILYGSGSPLPALRTLAPHVVQAHIKDATPTQTPGTWGTEVRAGTGAVAWHDFLSTIEALPQRIDLIVEREAGTSRVADIKAGLKIIHDFLNPKKK